jgi:hypothetical protein
MQADTKVINRSAVAKAADITGEQWLKNAETALRPTFTRAGLTIPEDIRYAVAFPSAGARSNTIGECWARAASSDDRHTIIIRADQWTGTDAIAVLIHELLHASLPFGSGHGPAFKAKMAPLHLTGQATATVLTQEGRIFADNIMHFPALGGFGPPPWGKLRFDTSLVTDRPKTQGTRMLKAACPCCGYTIRLSRTWAEKGLPDCPLDGTPLACEAIDG